MKSFNDLEVSEELDQDDEIEFCIVDTDTGSEQYCYLNKESILELIVHLQAIVGE